MSGKIEIGKIISTNYNTGPYVIRKISGPCRCPDYLDHINNMGSEIYSVKERFHLIVTKVDGDPRNKYYLNGYDINGRSVRNDDYLIFEGIQEGVQTELLFQ